MNKFTNFSLFTPMRNEKIITTGDGSHSLLSSVFGEQYHSTFGAIQESMHIFIEAGFKKAAERKMRLNILEMGTGTGLNLILTLKYQENRTINYTGIEAFPPSTETLKQLNYPGKLQLPEDILLKIYNDNPGTLNKSFRYNILISTLQETVFPQNLFDVVYFDAFSPEIQPELWTGEIFSKISKAMVSGGILTTYSSKGIVKRALKSSGFQIEKLPGPPGKREFLRAVKL